MQTGALKIPHTVSFLSMLERLKFQYLISNLESFRTKSYLACLFVLWVGAFLCVFLVGFFALGFLGVFWFGGVLFIFNSPYGCCWMVQGKGIRKLLLSNPASLKMSA